MTQLSHHRAFAPQSSIEQVIAQGRIRSVFQPIVDLATGRPVAAEALSRGPAGTALESPMAMLDAASAAGCRSELDELMLVTALRTATAAPGTPGLTLFVNAEPGVVTQRVLREIERAVGIGLPVVVELTERDLAADLSALLRTTDDVRHAGARIAIDDLGADPMSLALVALVRPEVVKLDMRLVRDYASGELSEIANAVRAYAEESGALVVAEGIESADDQDIALVLGGHLGQGWHYGRPADAAPTAALPALVLPTATPGAVAATPFAAVAPVRPTAVTTKRLLLPMSHTLERRGAAMVLPPLLLAAFQDARHFTAATAVRYAALAAHLPYVCALAADLPRTPAPGVYGATLDSDDALAGEWSVVVLGAHFAAALVARDLGDSGPEPERRFEYAITHDRSLVTQAALALTARLSS